MKVVVVYRRSQLLAVLDWHPTIAFYDRTDRGPTYGFLLL